MSGFESAEDANVGCQLERMANAIVRQVDEIAVRDGCELPVTLLTAIARLFGEHAESQFGPVSPVEARYQFTRCGQ